MGFAETMVSILCAKAGFLPLCCSLPLSPSPASWRERAGARVPGSLPLAGELLMGLRPTRASMKIQFLPLTRGRLGGGGLNPLLSEQITQGSRL
jgi:hypothetical protein